MPTKEIKFAVCRYNLRHECIDHHPDSRFIQAKTKKSSPRRILPLFQNPHKRPSIISKKGNAYHIMNWRQARLDACFKKNLKNYCKKKLRISFYKSIFALLLETIIKIKDMTLIHIPVPKGKTTGDEFFKKARAANLKCSYAILKSWRAVQQKAALENTGEVNNHTNLVCWQGANVGSSVRIVTDRL